MVIPNTSTESFEETVDSALRYGSNEIVSLSRLLMIHVEKTSVSTSHHIPGKLKVASKCDPHVCYTLECVSLYTPSSESSGHYVTCLRRFDEWDEYDGPSIKQNVQPRFERSHYLIYKKMES